MAATAGVLLERLAAKGEPRLPLLCLGEQEGPQRPAASGSHRVGGHTCVDIV